MRLIRPLLLFFALAAHLSASIAFAGPRLVEICTAHGVEYRVSDEDADQTPCEICLAVCDLTALADPVYAVQAALPAPASIPAAESLAASLDKPASRSRGPPLTA